MIAKDHDRFRAELALAYQTSCVYHGRKIWRGGAIHALWNPEDNEKVSNIRYSAIYGIGVKFCFALLVCAEFSLPE